MVTDLQGVRTPDGGYVLTDPAILCEDLRRFTTTNLGEEAMERCLAMITARLDE
jgi:hypothetical protein